MKNIKQIIFIFIKVFYHGLIKLGNSVIIKALLTIKMFNLFGKIISLLTFDL